MITLTLIDAVDDDGDENAARRELITLTITLTASMKLQKLRDGNFTL
jgi:hypothetical protein